MIAIIWQCPSCEDLKDYHNTNYQDAMNILCYGKTDSEDIICYEIRTAKRDCSGCRDDIYSP